MKFKKFIIYFFCFFKISFCNSNADISVIEEKFNNLILNNHNFEYPYLESRNDIGIFYDFAYDEKLNEIIVKRSNDNYPIVRFSLFNTKDIKPGDKVIKYNNLDLSKINDEKLIELHKNNLDVKLIVNNKEIFLQSKPYKLNDIKLANFFLNYINRIDTTQGILEISFESYFKNKKPEFQKYAEGLLIDDSFRISEDLEYIQLFPINEVVYNEYKFDVDIRDTYKPFFSYDNGEVNTFKEDRGVAQFRQKFDFKKFPFDTQKLKIGIIHTSTSNSDPNKNWPRGVASISFVTPDKGAFLGLINYKNKNILKEIGWTIVSTDILSKEIIEKNFFDPFLNEVYDTRQNGIDLVIEIKRNSAHYVFKIIIPVFLILCVAWSVLWIPTYKLDARLTTSIVALLALIAYNFVFEGDIPKLEYLTNLDKFILLSYVFCCIPTFSSVGFSRLIKKTDKLQIRATRINSVIRKWGALIYLLIILQIFKPFV